MCKQFWRRNQIQYKNFIEKKGKVEKKKNINIHKFYINSRDILAEIVLTENIRKAGYESEIVSLETLETLENREGFVLFVDINKSEEFYDSITRICKNNKCYIVGIEDKKVCTGNLIEKSVKFNKIIQKPFDKEFILKVISDIGEEFIQKGDE